MKVLVLYRPNSDHGRIVEDFIRDYQRAGHSGTIEALNLDSREGAAMASLYDVVQYPSIIIVRQDGSALRAWQGRELPLQSEVAAYAYS
ncbi:hypothetical protein H7Y63_03545 [Polaromonas sp.]|nr:hypothetical protein [Candidatus Saccharibacteria bacterium]